jgi:hypothetical protein
MPGTVSAPEEIMRNLRQEKMFVLRISSSPIEITIIIMNAAILPGIGIAHRYNVGLWNKPAGSPAFIAVFSTFGILKK